MVQINIDEWINIKYSVCVLMLSILPFWLPLYIAAHINFREEERERERERGEGGRKRRNIFINFNCLLKYI